MGNPHINVDTSEPTRPTPSRPASHVAEESGLIAYLFGPGYDRNGTPLRWWDDFALMRLILVISGAISLTAGSLSWILNHWPTR